MARPGDGGGGKGAANPASSGAAWPSHSTARLYAAAVSSGLLRQGDGTPEVPGGVVNGPLAGQPGREARAIKQDPTWARSSRSIVKTASTWHGGHDLRFPRALALLSAPGGRAAPRGPGTSCWRGHRCTTPGGPGSEGDRRGTVGRSGRKAAPRGQLPRDRAGVPERGRHRGWGNGAVMTTSGLRSGAQCPAGPKEVRLPGMWSLDSPSRGPHNWYGRPREGDPPGWGTRRPMARQHQAHPVAHHLPGQAGRCWSKTSIISIWGIEKRGSFVPETGLACDTKS